jgi:hypothetical protein
MRTTSVVNFNVPNYARVRRLRRPQVEIEQEESLDREAPPEVKLHSWNKLSCELEPESCHDEG